MAQAGRPRGRTYSEMLAFVVTSEMAAAIRARAEQEKHTISGWLRCAAQKELEAKRE